MTEGSDFVYLYTLNGNGEQALRMLEQVKARAIPAYCAGDLKFERELRSRTRAASG